MVRSQWEPFANAVARLGRPVRRLLLTHAHVDHVGGTRAFPMASVLGSPQTSELLDGEMPVAAYKSFMPAFTTSSTSSPSSARGRSPISSPTPRSSHPASRCSPRPATPKAT